MPTIQIADEPHPKNDYPYSPNRRDSRTSTWDADVEARQRLKRSRTTESEDGIYNIRHRTGGPLRRVTTLRSTDEDPGVRRDGDFKKRQVRVVKSVAGLQY